MWSGAILADSFIEFTPSHSPAVQESYCDVIPFTCTPRSEDRVNMKLWLCVLELHMGSILKDDSV